MFRNLFSNLPDVTKNLLILNVLFFLATVVFSNRLDLVEVLGMHYPGSNLFKPYQLITHFFMHGGFYHILFNMVGLVVFGAHLERYWGAKRFFIFYIVTAIGAVGFYTGVQMIEVYKVAGSVFPNLDILEVTNQYVQYETNGLSNEVAKEIVGIYASPLVGASGAIYGLIMAFALLFPNTEFILLFPPIPIKAKWLALFLGLMAVYLGYQQSAGDSVAHFAHLGGMIFGFILIQIWKRDKRNFY